MTDFKAFLDLNLKGLKKCDDVVGLVCRHSLQREGAFVYTESDHSSNWIWINKKLWQEIGKRYFKGYNKDEFLGGKMIGVEKLKKDVIKYINKEYDIKAEFISWGRWTGDRELLEDVRAKELTDKETEFVIKYN